MQSDLGMSHSLASQQYVHVTTWRRFRDGNVLERAEHAVETRGNRFDTKIVREQPQGWFVRTRLPQQSLNDLAAIETDP